MPFPRENIGRSASLAYVVFHEPDNEKAWSMGSLGSVDVAGCSCYIYPHCDGDSLEMHGDVVQRKLSEVYRVKNHPEYLEG